jgi:citrate lyase beta subunit
MRARRALFYVPGNELEEIKEAITMGVDCICMDLEFGVPLSEKEKARKTIVHALNNLDFRKSERLIRINPVRSDLAERDLLSVLNARPEGIVLPKVDAPERLQWVNRQMNAVEAENDWPEGLFKLHATIESAQGVINLPRICDANERLESLIFGADDITIDLGATRTKEAWEMFYARSAVVLHASAFGLHAIDMLYTFDAVEGLTREARLAEGMGFAGKQVIKPWQVEPVQDAFTPHDEAIARAKELLIKFTDQGEQMNGIFTAEGKMVDIPMVKSTLRLLERARAAGKLKG